MLTLKRLALYIIIFLVTSLLAISIVNWKMIDYKLVSHSNRMETQANVLNKDLVFVHLDQSGDLPRNIRRKNTIDVLTAIQEQAKAKNSPKGVVLDIWFGSDTTSKENLLRAIRSLQAEGVPIYASYNIHASGQGLEIGEVNFDDLDAKHLSEVYDVLADSTESGRLGVGRYHTNFYAESGMASYENNLIFRSTKYGDDILIEALVHKVARDLGDSKAMLLKEQRRGSIVPYASQSDIKAISYRFEADSALSINSFKPYEEVASANQVIDMDNKIVIVGDPAHDRISLGGDKSIAGPYVVTWAIGDLLDGNARLKLPIENTAIIIGQMLFFSFSVVFVFAFLFKYVKLLQTKPVIIAIISFSVILVLLFCYYQVLLTFQAVAPVGQTIAAMLVAAALSWRFAFKFLVTGVAEGSQKYDIFISYSHGPHADWVEKHVYEPLSAYRNPVTGDKLNIFFDKKSIGIGEAFTSKYMWAIVDTKCFVPVITSEYYQKNHCKNELDLAVNRYVEKLIKINMIAFDFESVPEPYRTFNYIEIKKNPNFIDTIIAGLE